MPETTMMRLLTVFGLLVMMTALVARAAPFDGSGNDRPVEEMARFLAISMAGHLIAVEGGSMAPVLKDGDWVVVAPVAWERLRPGDVVSFEAPEEWRRRRQSNPCWIHQVVWKKGEFIQTRGINNKELDPFRVHRRAVVGRVVAVFFSEVPRYRDSEVLSGTETQKLKNSESKALKSNER